VHLCRIGVSSHIETAVSSDRRGNKYFTHELREERTLSFAELAEYATTCYDGMRVTGWGAPGQSSNRHASQVTRNSSNVDP